MNSLEQELRQRMAALSNTNAADWFVISRARYGMELVFRTIAETRGDGEVITQPLTCITAVNPIIAAHQQPVYCDISAENWSINTSLLTKLLTSKTRAVVLQHGFGMAADVAGARQKLGKKDVLLVEDSAHCLGYLASDGEKPLADVSIHSFGAEKLLGTRAGAAIWLNPDMKDQKLRTLLVEKFTDLPDMEVVEAVKVALYPAFNGMMNHLPGRAGELTREILLSLNMLRSPIISEELEGKNPEAFQKPSRGTIKAVLKELGDLEANLAARQRNKQQYIEALRDAAAVSLPSALLTSGLPCVRFPLLAATKADADRMFTEGRRLGHGIGKWYRPLLFPGPKSYKTYFYEMGSCPVAEDISDRLLNLPTGVNITETKASEVAKYVAS